MAAKVNVSELPPHLREIWDEMMMPVDTNIQLSDVILSDENKAKVKAFIKESEYREKLQQHGLQNMNRILMYGASGTGKTYLSKALCNHLHYTMLYVDISKALAGTNVAQNIADIFELGNYLGNSMLFFDECDSIAWNRDAGAADSGRIRRATNSIFQYLDQMNSSNIFVACTNMLYRLDPAFERRFNLKLEFRRPELNMDDVIKHFLFNEFVLIDDVDENVRQVVQKRMKQYVKLSYYELQGLVERAMKNAVLRDSVEVHTSEIYAMLADSMNFKIKFGTADDKEEIFHNDDTFDPRYNKNTPKDYQY